MCAYSNMCFNSVLLSALGCYQPVISAVWTLFTSSSTVISRSRVLLSVPWYNIYMYRTTGGWSTSWLEVRRCFGLSVGKLQAMVCRGMFYLLSHVRVIWYLVKAKEQCWPNGVLSCCGVWPEDFCRALKWISSPLWLAVMDVGAWWMITDGVRCCKPPKPSDPQCHVPVPGMVSCQHKDES